MFFSSTAFGIAPARPSSSLSPSDLLSRSAPHLYFLLFRLESLLCVLPVRAAGGSTTTFDVCYHPEALVRAQKLDAFRDLVALSSLERVEDAFLRGTEQKITVDKSELRIVAGSDRDVEVRLVTDRIFFLIKEPIRLFLGILAPTSVLRSRLASD